MALTKTKGPITGVCGGIGKNLGIDPTIVRILFVVGTLFFFGTGIIAYVILALIMPRESSVSLGSAQPDNSPTSNSNKDIVFCRNCGFKNETKGKFCRSCGAEL